MSAAKGISLYMGTRFKAEGYFYCWPSGCQIGVTAVCTFLGLRVPDLSISLAAQGSVILSETQIQTNKHTHTPLCDCFRQQQIDVVTCSLYGRHCNHLADNFQV